MSKLIVVSRIVLAIMQSAVFIGALATFFLVKTFPHVAFPIGLTFGLLLTLLLILVIYWLDKDLLTQGVTLSWMGNIMIRVLLIVGCFTLLFIRLDTNTLGFTLMAVVGISQLIGITVGVFMGLLTKEPGKSLGQLLLSLKSRPLRGAVTVALIIVSSFALLTGLVNLWVSTGPGSERRQVRGILEHAEPVLNVAISAKADLLVTRAGSDIWLWPLKQCINQPEVCQGIRLTPEKTESGIEDIYTGLALSAEPAMLLTGTAFGSVRIYQLATCPDPLTGCKSTLLLRFEEPVTNLALSPEATMLALGSGFEHTAELWQVDECQQGSTSKLCGHHLHTLRHEGTVSLVAFAPDGTTLASVDDKTLRVWQVEDGRLLHRLDPEWGKMLSLAFVPEKPILVVGGCTAEINIRNLLCYGGTVWLWRIDKGQLLRTLELESGVLSVAIDPTGQVLATGTIDGQILLWDLEDAADKLITTREGHIGPVLGLAFSPDGTILASSSGDQMVRLWQAPDQGWQSMTHTTTSQ